MKRNIYNFTILSLLLLCLVCILTHPKEIMESGMFSLEIWKKNIFPSLFPFFILSDLLIYFGFAKTLGNFLSYPVKKLFHLRSICAFVLVMSLFSGFPSSAKYIATMYKEKKITLKEANHLIKFTHFSNPLFIMGTVFSLLQDKKICFFILISHYIANIILGILYREKIEKNESFLLKKETRTFLNVFKSSIDQTISTLTYILGTITIFLVLSTILFTYIQIDDFSKCILRGMLEITQGIKYVSLLSISKYLKGLIITGFLSFGGLCIHIQVLGIIKEIQIKYSRYLLSRILHVFFACILYSVFSLLC